MVHPVKPVDGSEKFLTRAQFAAARGWSPSYVTKLGHQGRLVLKTDDTRLVDVAATLELLGRTADPRAAAVRQRHLAARIERHVTPHTRPDAPADSEEGRGDLPPKYWANKALREGALAELARLDLAQRRGELVDRAGVEAMAFAVGRQLRDTLMVLPPRLAPEFASMGSAFEIEVKLRDALRQVLADMTRASAEDLRRLRPAGADATNQTQPTGEPS